MRYIVLLLPVAMLPSVVQAAETIPSFVKSFTAFLGNVIVPFLLGIAFLILAFNAIRYFVIGGANEEDRGKAKNLAIYSVMGLVIIMIFWGIVNLLSNSFGLANDTQPISDYVDGNSAQQNSPSANNQLGTCSYFRETPGGTYDRVRETRPMTQSQCTALNGTNGISDTVYYAPINRR